MWGKENEVKLDLDQTWIISENSQKEDRKEEL